MQNVLVIGAGGIGSFFIETIMELKNNFVKGLEDVDFTVSDNDEVEEKNILYQNFTDDDILENKAEVLSNRYERLVSHNRKIETDDELKSYDIIVIAADNNDVRKLVFQHCYDNNKYFLDLRSEGRGITLMSPKKTLDEMFNTLGDLEGSTSCQLQHELDDRKIQLGNRIVAQMGAQALLNHLRGDNSKYDKRLWI